MENNLIVYFIFTNASLVADSVQQKVIEQIDAMNAIGLNCKGVFFSTEIDEKTEINKTITIIPVKKTKAKYFNKWRQVAVFENAILEFISVQNKNSFYYIRYPQSSNKLLNIAKSTPNLIFELNDPILHTLKKSKIKFSLKPSIILHLVNEYYWPLLNEKLYAPSIFRKSFGIVSVSEELFEMYEKWYSIKSKKIIIGNGINTKKFSPRNHQISIKQNNIKMLILKGASVDAPYLGLERVFYGLKNYKGIFNFQLLLAGKHFEKEIELAKSLYIDNKIENLGYLNHNEINTLSDNVDIAIGTLSPYISGINEISSLKAREYIVRGIPFIYGYVDTDLVHYEEANNFSLQVENNDSPLDFYKVEDFILNLVQNNLSSPLAMNKFAIDKLDWQIKMKKLKTFIIND